MLPSLSHSLSASHSSPSPSRKTTLRHHRLPPSPQPPFYIKFRTTRQENLRYLKAIGIIDPNTKQHKLPPPTAIAHIFDTINFFKSKGFSDSDFARLAYLCPQLFSQGFDTTDIDPVFQFLSGELQASAQESRGLILKCPQLLLSDVEFCLKPTLDYYKQLGVTKLNVPKTLNAHLLVIHHDKLRAKVQFLRSIGLSHAEAARICARLPSIFCYGIESNLRPKFDFFVEEMGRSLEELKEFPQYFAFSFQKRIVPRHFHLKERNAKMKLNSMLMWSDQRFYAKWK